MDTGAGCQWSRAPETRVRGLTPHCRRDPRNTKGDKTNSLGLLSAWAPWRSEVGGRCGGSLIAAP